MTNSSFVSGSTKLSLSHRRLHPGADDDPCIAHLAPMAGKHSNKIFYVPETVLKRWTNDNEGPKMLSDITRITDNSKIVSSDGVFVGTVQHVDGDRLRLARDASSETACAKFIAGDMVDSFENGTVWLRVKAGDVVLFDEQSTTYQR